MTYMATPNIRTPALGAMESTILVNHSLVIITIYLVCLIYDLYDHTLAQEPLPLGS